VLALKIKPMTKTYTLKKIEQIIDVATTLSRSWFRGHTALYDELNPGIFRCRFKSIAEWRPIEFSVIEDFKREAPALIDTVPPWGDHLAWLFLIQHHGSPTRLLDWTENALVALFFAVSNQLDKDGELWAMYPDELNRHSGFQGMPLSNNRVLRYLAGEPSHNPEAFAKELGLSEIPKYPLALRPPMTFRRMAAQFSTFTIHPAPQSGCTIPDLLTDERHLVRYIIPSSNKKKLRDDLAALKISTKALFPDLDALSKCIMRDSDTIAYGPPIPPKWEHE
jgi:hypothetical protein